MWIKEQRTGPDKNISATSRVIVSRAHPGYYLLPLALLAISVFAFSATPRPSSLDAYVGVAMLYVPLLGIAGMLTCWYATSWIRADSIGLRWFHGLRVRQTRWEDVIDYYICPDTRSNATGHGFDTADGSGLISGLNMNVDALKLLISTRAVNSRSSRWQVKGTRLEIDGPQEFRYMDRTLSTVIKTLLLCFAAVMPFYGMQWIVGMSLLDLPKEANSIGWPLAAGMALPILSLPVGIALFIVAIEILGTNKLRKFQTVLADVNGLTFQDAGNRKHIQWKAVDNYTCVPSKKGKITSNCDYVVHSRTDTIDFDRSITRAYILMDIIRDRAINAPRHRWPTSNEYSYSKRSSPSAPSTAKNEQIFHYRTRIVGSGLIGLTIIAAVILLAGLFCQIPRLLPVGLTLVIVAVDCWFVYWTSGIAVEMRGIRRVGLFASPIIPWSDITGSRASSNEGGSSFYLLAGKRKFWINCGLADFEVLKDLIEERVPGCKLDGEV